MFKVESREPWTYQELSDNGIDEQSGPLPKSILEYKKKLLCKCKVAFTNLKAVGAFVFSVPLSNESPS